MCNKITGKLKGICYPNLLPDMTPLAHGFYIPIQIRQKNLDTSLPHSEYDVRDCGEVYFHPKTLHNLPTIVLWFTAVIFLV
jgi:hypothetical protein